VSAENVSYRQSSYGLHCRPTDCIHFPAAKGVNRTEQFHKPFPLLLLLLPFIRLLTKRNSIHAVGKPKVSNVR